KVSCFVRDGLDPGQRVQPINTAAHLAPATTERAGGCARRGAVRRQYGCGERPGSLAAYRFRHRTGGGRAMTDHTPDRIGLTTRLALTARTPGVTSAATRTALRAVSESTMPHSSTVAS